MKKNGFLEAKRILLICDPYQKIQETFAFFNKIDDFNFNVKTSVESIPIPGRPDSPILVPPSKLPMRKMTSKEGVAAMIHAIAHIEFNAINIGLDAVYRFQNMPEQYYYDWLFVANDEAKHFSLLNDYLNTLDYQYGSFNAHNRLWDMTLKTESNCLHRMALVPRVLEARGLDVTPSLLEKFAKINDHKACEILEIIQKEEVKHVEIGNYWYKFLCDLEGLNYIQTFEKLLNIYAPNTIRPPINKPLRKKAGFNQEEINFLMGIIEKQ
ncbi:MAG: ferritin-like domain-containing protein [Rickettsiales bacterium]|nr:ferritin-like domain-containing protein [Rickettsiales bacterium]